MEGGEMEQEAEGRRAETRRVNGGETTRKSKIERQTSGRRLEVGHASHFEETLDIGGFRSSLSRVHKCFRPTCCLLGDIYTSCTSLCGLLCKNNLTSHARMSTHVDRFAFWFAFMSLTVQVSSGRRSESTETSSSRLFSSEFHARCSLQRQTRSVTIAYREKSLELRGTLVVQ